MGALLQGFYRDCPRRDALSRLTSTSTLGLAQILVSQVDENQEDLPGCRERKILHRHRDGVDLLSDGFRLVGSGAPNWM